jgi:alkylated DNA repair dioxygenase AlkB
LSDGSLLLMAGATQENWLHGINKSARSLGARINLTFRYIV